MPFLSSTRSLLLVLALCALAGCGDDALPQGALGPSGPPSLRLIEPVPNRRGVACAAIGTEVDARVSLVFAVRELVLRPPGACGSRQQCGHLELWVDGVLNNESAVPTIDLLLRKLADRYHDGRLDADGEPDRLRLHVLAVDDDGVPLLDREGWPLQDGIELLTVPSCRSPKSPEPPGTSQDPPRPRFPDDPRVPPAPEDFPRLPGKIPNPKD